MNHVNENEKNIHYHYSNNDVDNRKMYVKKCAKFKMECDET